MVEIFEENIFFSLRNVHYVKRKIRFLQDFLRNMHVVGSNFQLHHNVCYMYLEAEDIEMEWLH